MKIVEKQLSDGSPVFTLEFDVKNAEGNQAGRLVIECVDKQHAVRLARDLDKAVEFYVDVKYNAIPVED